MQQIADWLEKLGLSEYAQRFADNAVDLSVVRDLTERASRTSAFYWASAQDTARHRRTLIRPPWNLPKPRANRCRATRASAAI